MVRMAGEASRERDIEAEDACFGHLYEQRGTVLELIVGAFATPYHRLCIGTEMLGHMCVA